MNIERRQVSAALLGAGLGSTALGLVTPAAAQGGPVEGTHYVKLAQPLPVPAGGKIEVVEFFSYACPHCSAFEPTLEGWIKKLPADVTFRRAPVPFLQNAENFQKLYFALETMGKVEALQRKVFFTIHVERARLDKPADIAAYLAKQGVDSAKFMDVFNSFSVQTRARQATQLSEAYKIDGVPALGIQGRFYTSVSLAGSPDRALAVTDFLTQRVRQGG
jgi:protein dithiol oxidoreductase (disulfide-forming)